MRGCRINVETPIVDYAFDNILVGQKNRIIFLINEGRIVEAQAALDVLYPLWSAAGYLYKKDELDQRIKSKIAEILI